MATFTGTAELHTIPGLNRALRRLPKDAKRELTEASKDIAESVASDARNEASALVSRSGGWKYLGPTIRAVTSSKPQIKMGSARKLPKHADGRKRKGKTQTVGSLLWGLEFGGGAGPKTQQFLPHLGTEGYALWPTVREHSEETQDHYSKALLIALEQM